MSSMNNYFLDASRNVKCDWLSWLGSPMLYDGGLFVNRSTDEQEEHDKHKYKIFIKGQETLGYKFEKILFDNLWNLYEK